MHWDPGEGEINTGRPMRWRLGVEERSRSAGNHADTALFRNLRLQSGAVWVEAGWGTPIYVLRRVFLWLNLCTGPFQSSASWWTFCFQVWPSGLALLTPVRVRWTTMSLGRPLLSPTLAGVHFSPSIDLCHFQDFIIRSWGQRKRKERNTSRPPFLSSAGVSPRGTEPQPECSELSGLGCSSPQHSWQGRATEIRRFTLGEMGKPPPSAKACGLVGWWPCWLWLFCAICPTTGIRPTLLSQTPQPPTKLPNEWLRLSLMKAQILKTCLWNERCINEWMGSNIFVLQSCPLSPWSLQYPGFAQRRREEGFMCFAVTHALTLLTATSVTRWTQADTREESITLAWRLVTNQALEQMQPFPPLTPSPGYPDAL